MGSSVSRISNWIFNRVPERVVILGLDGTGKTSMLYRLKTGGLVDVIPTMQGCNIEQIELKYSDVFMFDVGGSESMSKLWRHYYNAAKAMIFVLDASDKERASLAAERFQRVVRTITDYQCIMLILANKQDLGNCLNEEEIIDVLGLRPSPNIKWLVQPCSIKEWTGVTEGLDWLSREMCK